jgi:hypothetical protein
MSVAAGSTGSLGVPATVHSNADRMMADPEVAADHSDPPDTQVKVSPWKKIGRTRAEGEPSERVAPATMVGGHRRRRKVFPLGP